MTNTQNPNLDIYPKPDDSDLSFTVMPKNQEPEPEREEKDWTLTEPKLRGWSWKLIAGGIIIITGLGFGGYFGYKKFFPKKGPPQPTPNIEVPLPDESKIDADNDGLTLEQETLAGANPKKADTDGDGLADGDEVNIYHTDPLLPDTDNDGYDDGREVARGYSPLRYKDEKADSLELQAWEERIAKYGLHEPTKTTLKLKAVPSQDGKTSTYTNQIFGYSIKLPSILAYRESQGGNEVGIYISGTVPEDIDFKTDPISISTAVATAGQTLKEWIDSQYSSQDYRKLVETEVNSLKVIRLENFKNETCQQTKNFFQKNNTIIILTLTCADNSAFVPLYENIVQSFKYVK